MDNVLLVSVSRYQEAQWSGMVEDMRGLIADGLDHLPHYVAHHARKRGIDPNEAQAALIQAKEF